MTSSYVNVIAGPLVQKSNGYRYISITKGHGCVKCCQPGHAVEHTVDSRVTYDALVFMWRHYDDLTVGVSVGLEQPGALMIHLETTFV